MLSVASCLGNTYCQANELDSAKYYLFLAMQLDTTDIAANSIAVGQLYLKLGNLDSARFYAANAERQYTHVLLVNDNERLKVRNLFFIVCFSISIILALAVWLYFQQKDKKRIQKINEQQCLLEDKEKKLNQLLRKLKENRLKEEESSPDQALASFLLEEIEKARQDVEDIKIEKIQDSTISKKIKKLISRFPNGEHALSAKDWDEIQSLIDNTFHHFPLLLEDESFKFTKTEIETCYLAFFDLKPDEEAILLEINTDSANKRRFRLRQKLGIDSSHTTLFEFLKKDHQALNTGSKSSKI